ncbi:MAG TPA: hypothetical protein VFT16_03215 [Candidatus Saccharimonadales bacterium]|nr:hypothetical protein [Candidatus Saccharimonadales bacterium]
MVSNNYGGQMPVYHRIPVFSQMPATDQQPVTEIRHDRLLQRPMVVQLHRLRPNDSALQDKLNQAVATRLWEPVRSKRAAALDALGFAATAGTIAAVDSAMYLHNIDSGWIMGASAVTLMAGMAGTLNLAEASKPALPQLPSEIDPPLRIEDEPIPYCI